MMIHDEHSKTEKWRRPLHALTLLSLYVLVSALVLFFFLARFGINCEKRATLAGMVYGTAHRPFVCRVLFPTVVRFLSNNAPQFARDAVSSVGMNDKIIKILQWNSRYLFEHYVATATMFCCFLATVFLMRAVIRRLYEYPHYVADFAPVCGMLSLPTFFRYVNYIYDPATLLLSTLILYMLVRNRVWAFYAVFILAVFNKETAIVFVGLFLVWMWDTCKKGSLIIHATIQTVIWGATRLWITYVFSNNPGSMVEFHLMDHNMRLPMRPSKFLPFLITAGMFGALVAWKWRAKPILLRRGLIVTLVPLMTVGLFLGFFDETRGYYEAFPFLFLLSLAAVVDLFDIEDSKSDNK